MNTNGNNAKNRLIEAIETLGEITRDQAEKVYSIYDKLGIIDKREGAHIGQYSVKHGGFLDKEVITRALAQAV